MPLLNGGRVARARICLVRDEAGGLQRETAQRFHGFHVQRCHLSLCPSFLRQPSRRQAQKQEINFKKRKKKILAQ